MRSKSSAKKSRVRKPFWEKWGPDVRYIADHVGHVIDNSRISDFIDAALYGGTALLGMQVTGDIRGALIGPIGLKLATSMNIVAGTAGVSILGVLGLAAIGGPVTVDTKPVQKNGQNILEVTDSEGNTQEYPIYCEYVGPLGSTQQCRCWYPGLGWVYVDKKFCEAAAARGITGMEYEAFNFPSP